MKIQDLGELFSDLRPQPAFAAQGLPRAGFFLTGGSLAFVTGKWWESRAGSWLRHDLGTLLKLTGRILLGLGAFSLFSYRDPFRFPLGNDPDFIYSPVDGRVMEITEGVAEPKFIRGPATRLTFACSLLDVHIQRAPVGGRVRYRFNETAGGKTKANYLGLTFTREKGDRRILLVQKPVPQPTFKLPNFLATNSPGIYTAGAGDTLGISQKIGLAGFGEPNLISLYLPGGFPVDILCKTGQHVQAGMTVIGRFKG